MAKKIITKLKNALKNNKYNHEPIDDFSINWFILNIPPVITTKKEFDKFISTGLYINKSSKNVIVKNVSKFDNIQIKLLLDLISDALESFLQYEQRIIHDMSILVRNNTDQLSTETKLAFNKYGLERYKLVTDTLKIYRDLSLTLFINKKED